MASYPQELAQDAVCQIHTGHMTGLWFLPTRPLRLNTNEWMLVQNTKHKVDFHLLWNSSQKKNKELMPCTNKGKSVPLQAWSSPEGSRKFRFPDYMTTAQDGGKVVSLKHRPPLPPQVMLLVLISVRGWVDPRVIVRSEGFYVNEKFQLHHLGSNQRPSDL